MFSKFTEVLQVFAYQSAVFYAQWTFVTYRDEFKKPQYGGFEGQLMVATIPLRDWLLIEFFSFYSYIGAAIIFIARHQIKAWISDYKGNERKVTDIKKQMTDFIIYQNKSLTWYAFNLLCCIMPPIIVFTVVSNRNDTQKKRWELTGHEKVMTGLICL